MAHQLNCNEGERIQRREAGQFRRELCPMWRVQESLALRLFPHAVPSCPNERQSV
jgi:hypothetical protein